MSERVERLRYFNCMLDPHYQSKMTPKMLEAVKEDLYAEGGALVKPTPEHPANLISSLCTDGKHRPALDIDVPCIQVPSSTEGHSHLYFPTVTLDWVEYVGLMTSLASVGILESRYVAHSIKREQSLLRPPGIRK